MARQVHNPAVMAYDGPERVSARVLTYCPVRLWGDPELAEGVCVNVSRGGMALSLPEHLPVGTLLRITAYFPDEEHQVDATAIVVWSRNHGKEKRVGVRFLSLSQEALSTLSNYINDAVAA